MHFVLFSEHTLSILATGKEEKLQKKMVILNSMLNLRLSVFLGISKSLLCALERQQYLSLELFVPVYEELEL